MRRSGAAGILGMLAVFALILDGETAKAGIREGLEMCYRVLIPSLFPFMFLSGLVSGSAEGCCFRAMKPVRRLFGFGPGTEPLLLMGLLGGYPVGAGIIGEAVRQGKLDKDAAARLLPCCKIPGPSFIFGILGPCFSSPRIPWAIWGLTILSAAVCARTFRAGGEISLLSENRGPDFSEVMKSSVRSVLLVCGWVILFRGGLRCLFSALPESCPPLLRVLLYGSLEMSNGCLLLPEVKTEGIRMAAAAGLVSFGGLCVFLQIRSAAPGLSMRYYIWGKLLESILSALAALLIFCLMMPESIGNFQDWQMVFRLFPQ